MSNLNIVNLSSTAEGGAGIMSREFNRLLLQHGYNSILIVKESKFNYPNVIKYKNYSENQILLIIHKVIKRTTKFFLNDKIGTLDAKYCFYSANEDKAPISIKKLLKMIPFKPDIVFLHWVPDFINTKVICELEKKINAKIFWIMMDNAPLTGGCHYPWDCKGFHTDCSDCPAILNMKKKYLAKKYLEYKKKYLPPNLEIIACSQMDYLRALESSLFKKNKIHKILLPVNENLFKPGDKKKARIKLGLPLNKKIIFFGATSLNEIRKGFGLLLQVLKEFREQLTNDEAANIHLLIAGNSGAEIIKDLLFSYTMLGYIQYSELPNVFQAADFFISPSIEDSGPTMVNQAIMCAIPVVAFNRGVAIDLVKNKNTGYLARFNSVADFVFGIKEMINLSNSEYQVISENCKNIGLNNLCFKKYYEKLLK